MFRVRWLFWPYTIISDEGFSVESDGPHGLIYHEGSRSLRIARELLARGPDSFVLYTQSIKAWEPPHNADPLSKSDIDRILANVQAAFRFVGTGYKVNDRPC
jgi:hypothetical protein